MSTLLVTTGATVTFKSLVAHVLSDSFLKSLPSIGISILIIQYGNEIKSGHNVSRKFYGELTKSKHFQKEHYKDGKNDNASIDQFSYKGLTIIAFPFSHQISDWISQASLVVSHAGTGSMVDTLRQGKPLLVVVNSDLMDNHQLEVAREFTALNFCRTSTVADLLGGVEDLLAKNDLTKFSSGARRDVERVILEEMHRM